MYESGVSPTECKQCGRPRPSLSASTHDGIELNRAGDVDETIRILLFLDYHVPTFQLSSPLAEIVGLRLSALPLCVMAVIKRAKKLNLIKSSTIVCDALFEQIFQSPNIKISDVPTALQPHLKIPPPIEVIHRLRLHVQGSDSETNMDIPVRLPVTQAHQYPIRYPGEVADSRDIDRSYKGRLIEIDQTLEKLGGRFAQTSRDIMILEERIMKLLHRRNMYASFSEAPLAVLKSTLEDKGVDQHEETFLDDFIINENSADFYRQPWAKLAANHYVQNINTSLEAQIRACQSRPLG
eukprot:GHVO01057475.1.p1 GENE.GHVO01057475.1~~GHVO01057475.1.p1  ORF type:complete len:295 (+),score=51.78 GHVO01057475.1:407-1291(+)